MIRPRTVKGILVQYIFIGLISITAVAAISMNVVSKYMRYEITDKGKKIIEVLASSINSTLEHPMTDLKSIKQILEDNRITVDKSHLLQNFLANRDYFVILQLADFTGKVTNIAPYSEQFVGIDVSRQEYFINTMQTDLPYWSSTHLSAQLDKPFVCLSIKTDTGILTAFLLPETILSDIQALVSMSRSFITVTDRSGVYIVHPDTSKVEQRVTDITFSSLRDSYRGGIFETSEIVNRREMIVYVEFINQLGWMLKVHQSLETALLPVKRIIIYLGTLALIFTAFFSLVSARYMLRVDKSLQSIIAGTEKVSDGDYKSKLNLTDFKDLNLLISSFNTMADSLSDREQQLKDLNSALSHQVERVTHAEHTFKTLIESTTGRYGQEFFDNLVKEIAGWLKTETVIMTLFDSKNWHAKSVAMYSSGKMIDNYIYPLEGSPCEIVASEGFKAYESKAAKLFPKDQDLQKFKTEAYIGTPLIGGSGDVRGVLCAISSKPVQLPEWGQDLMEIVASKAVAELERHEAEQKIHKSLEEKEIMLKEIHHRVKNNMQVVIGLLNLQMESSDPHVVAQLTESVNRIYVMALLHQKLYQADDLANVELKDYLGALMENIMSGFSSGRKVTAGVSIDKIKLPLDNIIPVGLIVNELVTNSLKHAFADTAKPEIQISLHKTGNSAVLTVKDNGKGFPEGFDHNESDSLGMSLVESLACSMNAEMVLESDGSGAGVSIIFRVA